MSAAAVGYNDTQARILHVLANREDPVVSSTIKDRIDTVTRSAVDAQLAVLVDRGVIEAVDERQQGGGIPAKVYALTTEGIRAVREHDVTPTPQGADTDDSGAGGEDVAAVVSSLTEQIEALREKVLESHERIDELETTVGTQSEMLAEYESVVDAQQERLAELAEEQSTAKERLKQRTADLDRRVSELESR